MNIQAILADKWVRIGGGILAAIFAVTFLPAIFGWIPDGGLIFFNIVLALVFFNVVVQRHPFMSLLWLYGLDLGLGIFMLLGTLPFFSESAMAGITVIVLIPLNIWTGFQFIREMGRKLSLQGKFLPAHEGGLTLEFTLDGNVILSNGKVYRYATRRNELLLYDGGTLVTKWQIAKCDPKTLLVKDDQGKLHEYKRDVTTATSTASVGSTGLGTVWEAMKYSQENARLQAKWTPQDGSSPSIEFTGDGAFVRSDGKAGKYAVDWTSKTISVTLTDKTPLEFDIISLSSKQMVLSENGVATTYTTTVAKRAGVGGASGQQQQTRSPEFEVVWEIPATDKRPAFTVTSETSRLEFENWSYDPSSDRLNTVFSPRKTSKDHKFHVLFFDSAGVQVDEDNFYTSSTLVKGNKYEGSVLLSRIAHHKQVSRVVIRER